MPTLARPIAIFLLVTALVTAQEVAPGELPAGHSGHGEVFNEGPRQAAELMGGTGDVHLSVTTEVPAAQQFFDQGLGQLHGFWYFEAERSFRQAAALDPRCAMAYWGMALANVDNDERAAGFAREAWSRRDHVTPHELLYVEALARFHDVAEEAGKKPEEESEYGAPIEAEAKPAKGDVGEDGTSAQPKKKRTGEEEKKRRRRYVADLEELIYRHPDDIEAKATLVNQLWLDTRFGLPITSRQANQALLDQIFAANPMHPAHHYRIHLWDQKDTSHRIVDSAVESGKSAPSIAHMWHMGGHTFDKLARFADAAWQQEASARVDHARMMRDRVMPFRIHNYAHNNEWLVRSLQKVGRVREAIALAQNMVELPRHPTLNDPDRRGSGASYGRQRLLDTLGLYELWDETLALSDTAYLAPGRSPLDRAEHAFAVGRAHAMKGAIEAATASLEALRAARDEALLERAAAMNKAEVDALEDEPKPEDLERTMLEALRPHRRPLTSIRQLEDALAGLLAFVAGDHDAALAKLEKAKRPELERAHLLLSIDRVDEALVLARKAAEDAPGQAMPLACLVETLWAAELRDEARTSFDRLIEISSRFDLDVPPFARLGPIAAALELPDDWRVVAPPPDDVAGRPELGDLGPFRWAPTPAPDWSVAFGDGNRLGKTEFLGRPVLVVFFLGFGCVHCVDQLKAIEPLAAAFATAGIDIVTVGTDGPDEVRSSIARGGEFPFPILSDTDGHVFREWGCWDDFEDLALHGTFLVDPAGRVRWQDVGYEPFMATDFLLEECLRLLALP